MRPTIRPRRLLCVLLTACSPSLSTECADDEACGTGRVCVGGVCAPAVGEAEAGPSADARPRTGDADPPSRDGLPPGPDARPSVRRDATPPEADGLGLDAAVFTADATMFVPDVVVFTADAEVFPPDAEVFAPDAAQGTPDAAPGLPDAAASTPDAARPPLPDAEPPCGQPEVCNALDDDCDGTVDEGVVVACGSDVGECEPGFQVCDQGVFGACSEEIPPLDERCDGRDNDCDGAVDEEDICNQGCGGFGQACCDGFCQRGLICLALVCG